MQTPNTQRLNWQHGGAEIPTVLLVILLNVKVLGDHRLYIKTEAGYDVVGLRPFSQPR